MSSGIITLTKCDANLVGISIGGGAPLCPHVYIVQVFDNTPAAIDQTLESGDRIVAVNNFDVNGRTKLEVARMIQNAGVSQISNFSFIGFFLLFLRKNCETIRQTNRQNTSWLSTTFLLFQAKIMQ